MCYLRWQHYVRYRKAKNIQDILYIDASILTPDLRDKYVASRILFALPSDNFICARGSYQQIYYIMISDVFLTA